MVKFMLLVSELWLSPAHRVILLCLRFPVFHKERLLFKLCSAADVCIMRLLLSKKKNKAVRKRVAVHVSHLEIALFDFTEWDSPLFTFLYLSPLYWPIYIYAGESCESVCVCVCLSLFYADGEKLRTGGQVQGTAWCFRGYPCWGNVFKIYYPHS